MATKSCSGSAILAIRHYKNYAFGMTENAHGPQTMENVAYSDFAKMLKNKNVHRTLTRSIFTHARNKAGFTIHSLVAAPSPFLQNVLESLTRQRKTNKDLLHIVGAFSVQIWIGLFSSPDRPF